ncbi:MAG: aldehyde dehydrogenase family protein [Coriobacteriales bacterium]|jgi:aldehyde dehydrogenase (NAD+)
MANVRKKQKDTVSQEVVESAEVVETEVDAAPEAEAEIAPEPVEAEVEAPKEEAAPAKEAAPKKSAKAKKDAAPAKEEGKGKNPFGKIAQNMREEGEKTRAEKKQKEDAKAAYRKRRIEEIEEQKALNLDGYNKAMAFAEAEDAEGFEYTSEDVYAATDKPTSVMEGKRTQKKLKKAGLLSDAPKKVRSKSTYTMRENNLEGGVGAIDGIIAAQREYYGIGKSRSIEWRTKAMERLSKLIRTYEKPLIEALHRDLGISRSEAYMTEIAPLHEELRVLYGNVESWTGRKMQRFVPKMWKTRFYSYWQPMGTVCIINSWKSPVYMALSTMAAAVAAGNTVVLKNSSRTWRCNEVIASAIVELFTPDFVRFIYGGDDVDEVLAVSDFDKVVYIGEKDEAQMMRMGTAQSGADLSLVLDGNCPVFVDGTFSVSRSAERIMWGKMLHAGQTRISPSVAYVRNDVIKPFVNELFKYVRDHYGKEPIKAEGYPRMFSQIEYDEACEILDKMGGKAEIVVGGGRDEKRLRIEPTVILVDSIDHPLLKKKIVGPILVVAPFHHTGHTLAKIIKAETPPAMYVFTANGATRKYIMQNVDFGSGCVNDTMIQISNRFSAQSGADETGMGSFGGRIGVEAFGSRKTVAVSSKNTHSYRFTEPGDDYSKIARWFHAAAK